MQERNGPSNKAEFYNNRSLHTTPSTEMFFHKERKCPAGKENVRGSFRSTYFFHSRLILVISVPLEPFLHDALCPTCHISPHPLIDIRFFIP
jgi:hypothetical protein